ncbi:MAG: T9SS type A sorting domain-containing protein [Bacteroidota bacterium]
MKHLFLFIIFSIGIFYNSNLYAQYGVVDSTFGVNGIVQTQIFTSGAAVCRNLIPLPDGKIVATGSAFTGANTGFALVRYNNDGTIDNTFGTQGITTTIINNSITGVSYCSVRQPDGKIILGGDYYSGSGYSFAVARYDTNGILDPSFGIGGISTYAVGTPGSIDNFGNAIALQSNGKIILAGTSIGVSTDFTVLRFNTDGSLDNTFGTQGVTVTPIGSGSDNCYSMTVQNDDKIILAGDINVGTAYVFTVARYDANGILDPSFGVAGIRSHFLGSNDDDYGYSVKMQQPGNKILVGGATNFNGSYDFVILRFDSTGTFDTSFGNGGIALTNFGSAGNIDYGRTMSLQPDGKILLAGRTFVIGSAFGIVRYDSNGNIDNSFGNQGTAYIQIASAQHNCYSVITDINNKILIAGQAPTLPDHFILVRYTSGLTTSISEQNVNSENNFVVYPNPSSGEITIRLNEEGIKNESVEMKIIDVTGKELYSKKIETMEERIHLSSISPGIYILQLLNGKGISSQKLIIN